MIAPMLCSLFIYASSSVTTLPQGFDGAVWGTGIEALKQQQTLHKAAPGRQYGYSDHSEKNPDVYIRLDKDKRIEYYFYKKKLYKVFIIYRGIGEKQTYYQQLVKSFTEKYGEPDRQYTENILGITVHHNLWQNDTSLLDIRSSTGYIYQVRIDKKTAAEKRLLQKFRHAI